METEMAENKMWIKRELPSSLGLIFLPQAASLSLHPSLLSFLVFLPPQATFFSFLCLFLFLLYTCTWEDSGVTFIFSNLGAVSGQSPKLFRILIFPVYSIHRCVFFVCFQHSERWWVFPLSYGQHCFLGSVCFTSLAFLGLSKIWSALGKYRTANSAGDHWGLRGSCLL